VIQIYPRAVGLSNSFTCYSRVLHIQYIIYNIHARLLSVQAQYNRLYPIKSSLGYYASLVILTVVRLTADKFKPLIFSFSGFTSSNIANICILMSLNDLCLLPLCI
jgi:hypothetical protein